MGTNYYYREKKNECKHCGRSDAIESHIGKSSYGWSFLFSDSKYKTARGWKKFLKANPDNIFNEYNGKVKLEAILDVIEHKEKEHTVNAKCYFRDSQGYDFSKGWFR